LVEDLFDNLSREFNSVSNMVETDILNSDMWKEFNVTHGEGVLVEVFTNISSGNSMNAVFDVSCGVVGVAQHDVSFDIVENEFFDCWREETVKALDNCSEIVRVEDCSVVSRFPTASVGTEVASYGVLADVALGGGLSGPGQWESVTVLVTDLEDVVARCTVVQGRSTSNSIISSKGMTNYTIANFLSQYLVEDITDHAYNSETPVRNATLLELGEEEYIEMIGMRPLHGYEVWVVEEGMPRHSWKQIQTRANHTALVGSWIMLLLLPGVPSVMG
jgi:hypothetical protein